MSGRLGANFRKGHLAEDLGNVFLRQFCAIAEVRQEDDFGIDSIATLLKPNSRILTAEKSFAVQIKSASVSKIDLRKDEIEWLLNQELPFFICTVNSQENEFKLFTINRFHYQMTFVSDLPYTKFEFKLYESPDYGKSNIIDLNEIMNEAENPKEIDYNEAFDIYLGQPILSATLDDTKEKTFKNEMHALISEWLKIEYDLIRLRKIDLSYSINWETGKIPTLGIPFALISDNNLKRDLLISKDYIERLTSFFYVNRTEDAQMVKAFNTIADWYHKNEIPINLTYNYDHDI